MSFDEKLHGVIARHDELASLMADPDRLGAGCGNGAGICRGP